MPGRSNANHRRICYNPDAIFVNNRPYAELFGSWQTIDSGGLRQDEFVGDVGAVRQVRRALEGYRWLVVAEAS
jgi:hypothetical protein